MSNPAVPAAVVALLTAALVPQLRAADDVTVAGPGGGVRFQLARTDPARLAFRVLVKDAVVVESSPLGVSVDGVDLGRDVAVGAAESYRIDAKYPWVGGHAEAVNRCNGAKVALKHAGGTGYTLEVRAFDDGVAFRFVV